MGDVNGAVSASKNAKYWNMVSLITGIVVLVLNGIAIGLILRYQFPQVFNNDGY